MKALTIEPEVKAWVLDRLNKNMRTMPPELERDALKSAGWKRRHIRRAVKELLNSGDVAYTYEFGVSFLERRFSGASRLGRRVITASPFSNPHLENGDVLIKMSHGASFGCGRHPTTRMAVLAIEEALAPDGFLVPDHRSATLDVGCGSGILALAAIQLGMKKAHCVDIDPCALFETRTNAGLNRLEDRVVATDAPIEELDEKFPLILANLRFPTLLSSLEAFKRISPEMGVLIVSGMRADEADSMCNAASHHGFVPVARQEKQDWAAITFVN